MVKIALDWSCFCTGAIEAAATAAMLSAHQPASRQVSPRRRGRRLELIHHALTIRGAPPDARIAPHDRRSLSTGSTRPDWSPHTRRSPTTARPTGRRTRGTRSLHRQERSGAGIEGVASRGDPPEGGHAEIIRASVRGLQPARARRWRLCKKDHAHGHHAPISRPCSIDHSRAMRSCCAGELDVTSQTLRPGS